MANAPWQFSTGVCNRELIIPTGSPWATVTQIRAGNEGLAQKNGGKSPARPRGGGLSQKQGVWCTLTGGETERTAWLGCRPSSACRSRPRNVSVPHGNAARPDIQARVLCGVRTLAQHSSDVAVVVEAGAASQDQVHELQVALAAEESPIPVGWVSDGQIDGVFDVFLFSAAGGPPVQVRPSRRSSRRRSGASQDQGVLPLASEIAAMVTKSRMRTTLHRIS
eukprot:gnl/MRDRNA2_/MRDRNA2_132550_c0_seq1.p1 gnl/MRDRNA2_/MRDRNA2_132550_c0~~gnl/MRDRNA2_/MRDRNA2_132550_c0_seq1.p1  ORF type:complete len:222 (+),score=27.71 gnl/MRDRNA2_/MRDRNA2_132550_c0_seq1:36-701(+)